MLSTDLKILSNSKTEGGITKGMQISSYYKDLTKVPFIARSNPPSKLTRVDTQDITLYNWGLKAGRKWREYVKRGNWGIEGLRGGGEGLQERIVVIHRV